MKRSFIICAVFLSLIISSQAQTKRKLRVEFEGNKIFSSETLLKKLNFCLAKYTDAEETYNARVFDFCLRRDVRIFLGSKGYLRAVIGEPQVQATEKTLIVRVSISEGILYRLGDIKIQGTKAFTSEQLLGRLAIKKGDIVNGEEFREWLDERIKKLYEDNGYIHFDSDLEVDYKSVTGDEKEQIANIEIIIDEGRPYTISRIEFDGNAQTSDQTLRNALLIKEGEVFSQQRFADSIERLNNLRLFDWIDKDKDVELQNDNESPSLKIKIKVKERKPLLIYAVKGSLYDEK